MGAKCLTLNWKGGTIIYNIWVAFNSSMFSIPRQHDTKETEHFLSKRWSTYQ